MTLISNQKKLRTELGSNVARATDGTYISDYKVLVYREKPFGKWFEPYIKHNRDFKMLTLDTDDRVIRASVDRVKLHQEYINKFHDNIEDVVPPLPLLTMCTL